MIARIWHGSVRPEDGDAYFNMLKRTGLKDYQACRGNRGVQILRREKAGRTHFLVLSLWESMESIREFAGPELERAVYYPEDQKYLLEFEPEVQHYEVLTWLTQPGVGS